MHRYASLAAAALLLCGCSELASRVSEDAKLLRDGVGIVPETARVQDYREKQDQYLTEYIRLAGLDGVTVNTVPEEKWPQVVMAGVNQINARCEAYKSAIDQVNRSRKLVNTELTATGAAAAAIMGVASASAKAISITATAFGLAVLTSDSLHSAVLYDLDPASVFTIISKAQGAVLETFDKKKPRNRVEAVQYLQAYIATCLPANIEVHVNEALKASTAQPSAEGGVVRIHFVNPLLEERKPEERKPAAPPPPAN